jgi:hypothetical protein
MQWPCAQGIQKVQSCFNANTAGYENNIHCHNVNTKLQLPQSEKHRKALCLGTNCASLATEGNINCCVALRANAGNVTRKQNKIIITIITWRYSPM